MRQGGEETISGPSTRADQETCEPRAKTCQQPDRREVVEAIEERRERAAPCGERQEDGAAGQMIREVFEGVGHHVRSASLLVLVRMMQVGKVRVGVH